MGLRILYLCIALDEEGAALANQVNWVRALAGTDGVESVTVLTPRLGRATLPPQVRVLVTNTRGWRKKRVRKVRRFRAALGEVDLGSIDLVFVAMGGGPYPLLMLPSKIRHHLPVVQWKADPEITRAMRFYARWCDDLVLTATPGSLPLDSDKVHAIGHGVDTDLFAPPDAPDASTRTGDLVIVGRIAPVKRIDAALLALAAHAETYGDCPTLDIIGRASSGNVGHLDDLHTLAATLGVEDRVRYVGTVPYAEMPARLAGYGACLQLGATALDKAILEAMAVGLPIVTSNRRTLEALPAALATRVGVDPDDADAQAARIHEMLGLAPGERTALGADLRAVVTGGHDINSLFDRAFRACAAAGVLTWIPGDGSATDSEEPGHAG